MITIKAKELDSDYGREQLLTHYLQGDNPRVYTILRKVSSSGMTRYISVVVANGDEITDVTYYAAAALGESLHETDGHRAIRQNGCGMDMGFNLVYNLSSVLYKGQERAGYVLKQAWL